MRVEFGFKSRIRQGGKKVDILLFTFSPLWFLGINEWRTETPSVVDMGGLKSNTSWSVEDEDSHY